MHWREEVDRLTNLVALRSLFLQSREQVPDLDIEVRQRLFGRREEAGPGDPSVAFLQILCQDDRRELPVCVKHEGGEHFLVGRGEPG